MMVLMQQHMPRCSHSAIIPRSQQRSVDSLQDIASDTQFLTALRGQPHDADPGKGEGDHHPRLFLSSDCIATRANAMVRHGVRLTQPAFDWSSVKFPRQRVSASYHQHSDNQVYAKQAGPLSAPVWCPAMLGAGMLITGRYIWL
jgi:hypothetical protein